jgi:hypothetical protein
MGTKGARLPGTPKQSDISKPEPKWRYAEQIELNQRILNYLAKVGPSDRHAISKAVGQFPSEMSVRLNRLLNQGALKRAGHVMVSIKPHPDDMFARLSGRPRKMTLWDVKDPRES